MCEEEDLDGQNNSANRKRHMWWESRQGTDEKNVRKGALVNNKVLIIGHAVIIVWFAYYYTIHKTPF